MVIMIKCKNCGHEYQSKVLQIPDEDALRSGPHEDIVENCPKCNQISIIMDQTFIGNKSFSWFNV
jgi:predicted Zn-ribbon and HTH transcriptional regulator